MRLHPDFIAGNTRLRARLPARLGAEALDRLVGQALPALVDALRPTAYGPHLPPGRLGPAQLGRAIQARLRETLRGVRDLYAGAAGQVVGTLLARHDLADALALLRGARTEQPPDLRLAALMTVGAVTEEAASAIARASDGAVAADRLAARRLPDPTTAAAIAAAWDVFAVNADPTQLEWTIAAAAHNHWTDVLESAGRAGRPILDFLRAERDRVNLVTWLAFEPGQGPRPLPGGAVDPEALMADPVSAVSAVHPAWAPALAAYARDGRLIALATAVDLATWRAAIRGLRRGDPLGAAIPLGYVVAAECEARDLRQLVRAARTDGRFDPRPLLVA